jgi:hypothetical protein
MCGEHAKETESALARAIFFTIFGSIEASCRIIAAGILIADRYSDVKDNPVYDEPPIVKLTDTEKQFLRQEKEEVSGNNWTPRQTTKFVALHDALIGYPTIYARIFGINAKFDKSCAEWQDFMRLKRHRDIGAHANSNELRSSPDLMRVCYSDIKRLLECRRWYCKQLVEFPGIARILSEGEIYFIDQLLEAGFSERCRNKRAKHYSKR